MPLKDFLSFLERQRLISEKQITQRSAVIRIPNPYVRRFIEVTGMWLEALTYRTLRSLPYIDDAMASVRFLWDECPNYLVNEIDALASKDSRLIVVSCKDVANISTDMLNELSLYAEKLGGEKAIKALVTSQPVTSLHLVERAKAMDIAIISFNGNADVFRQQFDKVLSMK
ncbi:MAG: DUF1887 family CARF protein, partial [Clostridia bacterium]|nr:DUF1887 family CARF protein [Clostridia bacterium]